MTNPTNQWMDPQEWMGQFAETASQTVDTLTNSMKMWNTQVKQILDVTNQNVNTAMETMQKANDQLYQTWETSVNQTKETYKTAKK